MRRDLTEPLDTRIAIDGVADLSPAAREADRRDPGPAVDGCRRA